MNKGQKKLLIIIVIILALVTLLIVYLSTKNHQDIQDPVDVPTNNNVIQALTNEPLYFTLQNKINDLYTKIDNEKNSDVYYLLDDIYKSNNNLTLDNVIANLKTKYQKANYTAKEIYYNPDGKTTYYFINGYLFNPNNQNYFYEANENYLIIVSNEHYVIKPLPNDIDIMMYARNYNKINMNLDNKSHFVLDSIIEDKKLEIYINDFLNLMFLDTTRAYQMLDTNMDNVYPTLLSFTNDINNIYNKLSASVFGYSVDEVDNKIVYSIKDRHQNTIIITENKVMDYTISF